MSSKNKRPLIKMILIGDSGVGKSCLMNQFINKAFVSEYKATIGADFLTRELDVNGDQVALQVWDTAGHEKFMSFGQAFYRGSECCFLVCDVTNEKSFESLDTWKAEFIKGACPSNPSEFPFVVLANKVDEDANTRVVTAQQLKDWSSRNNDIPYYETSAKTGMHVEEAFINVANRVMKAIKKDTSSQPPIATISLESTTPQEKPQEPSKNGCC
ncbi:GTP-binding protein yptV5, putative [Entamoeba invadens IP1]|uniref:Ras-related protein Rab-7b n=1 Tax=Entamoeba invadens IP1 TaxID=370355 RepID=A0A0A1UCJ4_ENTIV|nr:GTP-binding protein yptV5, putative [Entamoeba invadens IP1]ELP91373.1 GTP-binding protein yptV5, putative [Entamoeba invadens IP1]|eukprot:XP_004258144.1 GTP-binding protein yptV5, putative [Entamoeba invadens IP1]